jgi:hypothetical protein
MPLIELQKAVGKVQFTGDAWSTRDRTSWFCATGHWIARGPDGSLVMKSAIIGFQRIYGAHTARNLANLAFGMLTRAKLLEKVFLISLS